jgi:hypothetical protein
MTDEARKRVDTLGLEHRSTYSDVMANCRWNTDYFQLQSGEPVLAVSFRPSNAALSGAKPIAEAVPVMSLAIKRSLSFFSVDQKEVRLIVATHAEESDGQNVVVNDQPIIIDLVTGKPQFFFGVEQIIAWTFNGLNRKDESTWRIRSDILVRFARLAAAISYEFKGFRELNKIVGEHIGELLLSLVGHFESSFAGSPEDGEPVRIFNELKAFGRSPESVSDTIKMIMGRKVDKYVERLLTSP